MDKKTAITELVKFAESQIGYKEKKSKKYLDSKTANAGSANYTKYAQFFDDLRKKGVNVYNGPKNPSSWCDEFVDYCFYQVFNGDTGLKMLYQPTQNSCGAGCKFSAGWFRENKAMYKSPEVGDVVYFGKSGEEKHTGIVVKVNAKSFVSVEGNKDNEVKKVTHAFTSGSYQFGRPRWALAAVEDDEPGAVVVPVPKPEPIAKPTEPAKDDKPAKKVITAEQMPEKNNEKLARSYKVNTKTDPLALRTGAGTNFRKLARMPKGAVVKCDGGYTGPWYFVTYETSAIIYRGFCWGGYLE